MKKFLAAILCFSLLLVPGCGKEEKRPSYADKTFYYHFDAEPKTLDPQIAADKASMVAIEALYEGLTRLDQEGNPYPGVAESWTANSDYTEFTFHLRSDAAWVSYTDPKYPMVTASDFVFAWRRAVDPATNSSTSSSMSCIKNAAAIRAGELPTDQLGVVAKDDQTLVVTLSYPTQDFPVMTASTPFMPCNQEFFESSGGRYGLDRKYLMGNGPFMIDGIYGWDHGKKLNVICSFKYKGNAEPVPMSIEFSIGKTAEITDPLAALLTKNTMDVTALPAEQLEAAKLAGCSIVSFEDTTWGLCFNMQGTQMKNENLRLALLQSLNREKILSFLPAGMNKADDIITPSTTFQGKSYRSLAGSELYMKQDEGAASRFSAALNELGFAGSKSADFSPAKVLCLNDENVKLMVNEMIVSWNRTFDRNFNMEPLSRDELDSRVQSGSYEIAVLSLQPTASGPHPMLGMFKSGGKDNPAKLNSAEYDSLLASAEQAVGDDAAQSMAAAEKYLNDHGIYYPLYYESHYYGLAKGVTRIVIHPYNMGIDFIGAGKE